MTKQEKILQETLKMRDTEIERLLALCKFHQDDAHNLRHSTWLLPEQVLKFVRRMIEENKYLYKGRYDKYAILSIHFCDDGSSNLQIQQHNDDVELIVGMEYSTIEQLFDAIKENQ